MGYDVFISYAAADKPIADAVCAELESRRIRCWIAPRDVLPGKRYAEAIIEALHSARVFVLVFSAAANDSFQVEREVDRAVSARIPMLPIRVEDVIPSDSMEYYLAGQHWLDALTPPLEEHLARLAGAIHILLGQSEPATSADQVAPERNSTPLGRRPDGTAVDEDSGGASALQSDRSADAAVSRSEVEPMPAETATVDPAPEGEPGLGNPRDDVEHHRATTGAPMHRRLSVVAVVVLIAAALLAAGYVMSRPRSQGTPSESATVRPLSPSASASSVAESPAATPASGASTSVRPHIVSNFIPFDSKRRKQMATYLGERYGDSSLVLDPRVIVLLNTATDTAAAAHKRFAAETIGRPGVVAHFIVDKDGTIYQDLATDLRGVHTVGLNHVAIGIAFVQSERGGPAWVDHQVLTRQRQLLSGLKLTAWLQQEYRIGDRDVIGHAMAPDSPFYKDYAHIESEKTDWPARDVAVFRQALRAMSGN